MSIIGKVESLWRYPVKSMRGEKLSEAFVGFSGIYGDRLFAFRSSASPKGFPYLTSREQRKLLQYRQLFRYPNKAGRPINLTEAESIAPGLNPVSADASDLMVNVVAPTGQTLAIDDLDVRRSEHCQIELVAIEIREGLGKRHVRIERIVEPDHDHGCVQVFMDEPSDLCEPLVRSSAPQPDARWA